MQILSVHNNYQIRGGEEESRESEERLLQEMGHTVETYEDDNSRLGTLSPLRKATKTTWSTEAYTAVRQQLARSPADIMHVQNFFPLISPSIYYAARAEGVPVVQSLRNYRLLCPNALFFRHGQVCEACLGQSIPYPGVLYGCYRGSRIASGAAATMLAIHRALQTWTEKVDRYIALTHFAREKFIQGGIPPNKIAVKPNFVHPDPGVGTGQGGYLIYVGRLSVEKGLDVLLSAWEQFDLKIPLKIVGDGPLATQVVAATKRLPQVEWLGRRPVTEVHALLGQASVAIVPSKWYETFGRVAVEAFAKGTPVIAANHGAIAELIDTGRTGLQFTPNDSEDLAAQIDWILAHPSELAAMRREARAEFLLKYTAASNYRTIMEIYESARSCANSRKRRSSSFSWFFRTSRSRTPQAIKEGQS